MSSILTLNAGSSSTKFAVYADDQGLPCLASGQVSDIGGDAAISLRWDGTKRSDPVRAADHHQALQAIMAALSPVLDGRDVVCIGHRIVHGGTEFSKPTLLTDDVINALAGLSPLAPLHQPHNLEGVAAAKAAFPEALQVGCFDTAFHRSQSWVNETFALPRRYYHEGVKRYGFHGLSYQSIASQLCTEERELLDGRVIVAHLGNGASLCAMRNGVSVSSTMGFSALDGLPMGTRCGQLDPGVILYFLEHGMTVDELTNLLYKESGLKGLSGVSNDMRALLESERPEAREAVDYFCFRIRREIGALTAVLGGLDALVFTAGIGERAPPVRAQSVEGLSHLGLEVDASANERNDRMIGAGAVPILVLSTDEERIIAQAASAFATLDIDVAHAQATTAFVKATE
ncbi:MAG: acetate/propionate family kinase [Pseudomonadota bacterium]